MKNILVLLLSLFGMTLVSCTGNEEKSVAKENATQLYNAFLEPEMKQETGISIDSSWNKDALIFFSEVDD